MASKENARPWAAEMARAVGSNPTTSTIMTKGVTPASFRKSGTAKHGGRVLLERSVNISASNVVSSRRESAKKSSANPCNADIDPSSSVSRFQGPLRVPVENSRPQNVPLSFWSLPAAPDDGGGGGAISTPDIYNSKSEMGRHNSSNNSIRDHSRTRHRALHTNNGITANAGTLSSSFSMSGGLQRSETLPGAPTASVAGDNASRRKRARAETVRHPVSDRSLTRGSTPPIDPPLSPGRKRVPDATSAGAPATADLRGVGDVVSGAVADGTQNAAPFGADISHILRWRPAPRPAGTSGGESVSCRDTAKGGTTSSSGSGSSSEEGQRLLPSRGDKGAMELSSKASGEASACAGSAVGSNNPPPAGNTAASSSSIARTEVSMNRASDSSAGNAHKSVKARNPAVPAPSKASTSLDALRVRLTTTRRLLEGGDVDSDADVDDSFDDKMLIEQDPGETRRAHNSSRASGGGPFPSAASGVTKKPESSRESVTASSRPDADRAGQEVVRVAGAAAQTPSEVVMKPPPERRIAPTISRSGVSDEKRPAVTPPSAVAAGYRVDDEGCKSSSSSSSAAAASAASKGGSRKSPPQQQQQQQQQQHPQEAGGVPLRSRGNGGGGSGRGDDWDTSPTVAAGLVIGSSSARAGPARSRVYNASPEAVSGGMGSGPVEVEGSAGSDSTPPMGSTRADARHLVARGRSAIGGSVGTPPNEVAFARVPTALGSEVVVNGTPYWKTAKIGRGGSSEVFRVVASDGEMFALKIVKVDVRGDHSRPLMESYSNEIDLLRRLKGNRFIINLVNAEVDSTRGMIFIVQELGETDLDRLLQQHKAHAASKSPADSVPGGNDLFPGGLEANFVRVIWQQMLKAVNAMHEQRVVHGDLKPANFVLVRGSLKLIDFGIAKAISTDTTNISRDSRLGTINYMCPEAFEDTGRGAFDPATGRQKPVIKLGRASDIWSLGCILYQMTHGRTPFSHLDMMQKMRAITNRDHVIPIANFKDASLVETLGGCLQRDPSARMPIAGPGGLLSHAYLHPVATRALMEKKFDALVEERVAAVQKELGKRFESRVAEELDKRLAAAVGRAVAAEQSRQAAGRSIAKSAVKQIIAEAVRVLRAEDVLRDRGGLDLVTAMVTGSDLKGRSAVSGAVPHAPQSRQQQ